MKRTLTLAALLCFAAVPTFAATINSPGVYDVTLVAKNGDALQGLASVFVTPPAERGELTVSGG